MSGILVETIARARCSVPATSTESPRSAHYIIQIKRNERLIALLGQAVPAEAQGIPTGVCCDFGI